MSDPTKSPARSRAEPFCGIVSFADDEEEVEIPAPTALAELQNDPIYQDGVWLLLDLDLTRIRPKAKRINITLPEPLLACIDAYARSHRMRRSGFLAAAAARAMATSVDGESQ